MQDVNNSFPHTCGEEFLFCGLSGIPVSIRSWSDSIEVPTSVLGCGGRGLVVLSKVGETGASLKASGAGLLDGRRVLIQKVEHLNLLGLSVELGTSSEVWSDGSIIDGVVKLLPKSSLSHAYAVNKKVVFCIPYRSVLDGVDGLVVLRHAVFEASSRLGITSSFMPISGGGQCGLLVDLCIKGDRTTLLKFCAGVILHSPECTVFTNSSHPSYVRLNSSGCAHYVCYGKADGALFGMDFSQDGVRLRCEYADNTGNPYLLIASILEGGAMGIEHDAKLPDEVDELNPSVTSSLVRLPMSLKEALVLCEGSGFLKRLLGESGASLFFRLKSEECKAFDTVVGEGEYLAYYTRLVKKP